MNFLCVQSGNPAVFFHGVISLNNLSLVPIRWFGLSNSKLHLEQEKLEQFCGPWEFRVVTKIK